MSTLTACRSHLKRDPLQRHREEKALRNNDDLKCFSDVDKGCISGDEFQWKKQGVATELLDVTGYRKLMYNISHACLEYGSKYNGMTYVPRRLSERVPG